MKYPNYNDCITNLACSVLKYFDCDYKHNTLKDIDKILEDNKPKNVIVLLYDGMGYNLVNRILPEDSFMRENMLRSYSSVCPATTTASTTAILSGLNPSEHGWLGWNLYIPPFGKIVTMFTNELKDEDVQAADYHVSRKYYPYRDLSDIINEDSKNDAYIVSPYRGIGYDSLNDMLDKIIETSRKDGKKYIYAYYEDPDATMHQYGTDSKESKEAFLKVDKAARELSESLEDTVLIITADHGHKNTYPILISNYPDFNATLDGDIWVEGRFCAFKVKDRENFVKLFNKYFLKDFLLKTKEEILKEKFFGDGEEHKYFRDSLGDYFAIGTTDKVFKYDERSHVFASSHAGITEDEMDIPLVLKIKK